jgi:hypothetical protein
MSKKLSLESLLSKVQENVQETVITESVIEASIPVIDFDDILTEWSYRCDSGYPTVGKQSDMLHLQAILEEKGIESPFERLTEAPAQIAAKKKKDTGAPDISLYPKSLIAKLTKADKLEKFYEFVKTVPGGDAPVKVADGISRICVNKGSEDSLVKLFKSGTSLKALTKINPEEGVNKMLFNVRPSGTGPGEVLIAWSIEGAAFQGGTVSYDIDFNGQHWEVKSLIDPDGNAPRSIDPAKYGKMSNFKFTRKFQGFWGDILIPYYENKLRDSVLELSDNDIVKDKLTKILDVLETIPTTTADGSTSLEYAGEITTTIFNKFYNSITQIHALYKGATVTAAAKSSRIAVKSSTADSQFWIDPKDVEDITKNAGKDTEVSIKVGTKITDENKSAKIWLSKLMNNEFIKNPKIFITELSSIRDNFGNGKEGIIYLTKGKFNLSNGMQDFFTSNITRSTYRFALKAQAKFANYEYQKEQI